MTQQGAGPGYEAIKNLAKRARQAYVSGDYREARQLSMQLLAENTDTRSWNYGNVIYAGNEIAGLAALRLGDVATARECLLAAGGTPGSPQLNSFGPTFCLADALLDRGECDVVLEFLDLVGRFWGNLNSPHATDPRFSAMVEQEATTLESWKAQIRAGENPEFDRLDFLWPL